MMSIVKELTKGICAVVKRDLEPFMRILGIREVYSVSSWDEAKEVLQKLSNRNDIAIILLQRGLVPQGVSFVDLNMGQSIYPIVVIVPDSKEALSEHVQVFYTELIHRFIGYEIRLE